MKLFNSMLALTLLATSCAHTKAKPTYEGLCAHPAAAGGSPFPIPPNAQLSGGTLVIPSEEGEEITLVGVTCILKAKSDTAK